MSKPMSSASSLLFVLSAMFRGHYLEAAVGKCSMVPYKTVTRLVQLDHAIHMYAKAMQTNLV